VPPSCGLLDGLAIGARVSLLSHHSSNAKCQRVLVLALCLIDCAGFNVPLNTLEVISGTGFMGQLTQPTVSKH